MFLGKFFKMLNDDHGNSAICEQLLKHFIVVRKYNLKLKSLGGERLFVYKAQH